MSIILALDFHFLVWFFDRSIDQGFGLTHYSSMIIHEGAHYNEASAEKERLI